MPKFIPLTMLKDTTGIVDFCQEGSVKANTKPLNIMRQTLIIEKFCNSD